METPSPRIYRFGPFEANAETGELRRQGMRVRLHLQPFQVLLLLVTHPGQLITREEISQALWPEGTFVDYEHGVNSAVNRLRDALGDKASSPRYIETMSRRGYRLIADVQMEPQEPKAKTLDGASHPTVPESMPLAGDRAAKPAPNLPLSASSTRWLATPEDLPDTPHRTTQTLFLLLQGMYLGFYVSTLANLHEISDLLLPVPFPTQLFFLVLLSAALLIPLRLFLACAVLFRAPRFFEQFRKLWPFVLVADCLWSLAPFLLLHHINYGLALAGTTVLLYAPFAQRSLMLMLTRAPQSSTSATGG